MNHLLLVLTSLLLLLSGCGSEFSTNTYNTPYVEDSYTEEGFIIPGHATMCNGQPDSMFCTNLPTIGDIQPTSEYATDIVETLRKNANYKEEEYGADHFYYNKTVYERLTGDCEDIAMTLIHHMVDEGIDKKYLSLVYVLVGSDSAHIFVAIDTIDKGMMHMDLNTKLAPIEAQINFHMRMNNAGVRNWIKGNIK